MKYPVLLFFACSFAFLASCTKEDFNEGADGLVKTLDSIAMDAQIGLIQLDDGNCVFISNGQLIKLDNRGNIAWRKPVTEISETRAAVAEPGAGFVLFGVPASSPTPGCYFACRYDADGNLLHTKQVNLNFPATRAEPPTTLIRLANGGFAMAVQSSLSWYTHVKILDHDFNLVHSWVVGPPASYWTFSIRQLCEMPGGDIAMVAAVHQFDNTNAWINSAYVLAGQDGTIKSLTIRGDTVVNQIANAVSPCVGGFFAASSTKTGWLSNQGAFVDYYSGTQIAGTMQIDMFNSEGQFTGSRQLTGYPGYGVIKSIRKTSDGGYLLCGTVGNNGSSVSMSLTKMYVCRLDAHLNEVWSKTFPTTYMVIGSDAVQTSDGGCLVTGNVKSFDRDFQMLMIQTDANGNY